MNLSQISSEGFSLTHSIDRSPQSLQYKIHTHACYEIYCFVSGNARYMVEGRIWKLEHGSLILTRPSEHHVLLMDGNEPYERYVLSFDAEFFSEQERAVFLAPYHDRPLGEGNFFSASRFGSFSPIAFFEAMERCNGNSVLIRSYLSAILSIIVSEEFYKKVPLRSRSLGIELVDFVNQHLYDPVNMTMVAENFRLSTSQVNRVFYSVTGTTVSRYSHAKRLLQAQKLISTGMGALEASQACGFTSYPSFFKLYKNQFGHPPSQEK